MLKNGSVQNQVWPSQKCNRTIGLPCPYCLDFYRHIVRAITNQHKTTRIARRRSLSFTANQSGRKPRKKTPYRVRQKISINQFKLWPSRPTAIEVARAGEQQTSPQCSTSSFALPAIAPSLSCLLRRLRPQRRHKAFVPPPPTLCHSKHRVQQPPAIAPTDRHGRRHRPGDA
jgi:hypothetical protein